MIGDLSELPEYSGDLDQLEKDAGALKKAASGIRDTGRDVHNDFQGLVSCYKALEADQLFHTTIPLRDRADSFATKLETASGALSTFARDARPLVQRMEQLRSEAAAFRTSIEGNHDWRKDQKNIDKAGRLVDPMAYVGKGAGFAKLKVGDMMVGLKEFHSGAANDFLHGADSPKIPKTHAPVTISDRSVRYPDGSTLHEDGSRGGRDQDSSMRRSGSASQSPGRHRSSELQ